MGYTVTCLEPGSGDSCEVSVKYLQMWNFGDTVLGNATKGTGSDLACKTATGAPQGPCPAGNDSCCDGPPGVGQSCYDSSQQDCCTTGPGKGHVCAKSKCSTRPGFICN